MGDSGDLQLRNVAVSHTALFKSIQAGAVGPLRNHRVWKGEKIININSTSLGGAPQGSISEHKASMQGVEQTRTLFLCWRIAVGQMYLNTQA